MSRGGPGSSRQGSRGVQGGPDGQHGKNKKNAPELCGCATTPQHPGFSAGGSSRTNGSGYLPPFGACRGATQGSADIYAYIYIYMNTSRLLRKKKLARQLQAIYKECTCGPSYLQFRGLDSQTAFETVQPNIGINYRCVLPKPSSSLRVEPGGRRGVKIIKRSKLKEAWAVGVHSESA